jgi:tetratricopeptide (TPR) repeat protein
MLIPFPAPEPETINFGELPPEIDALLQKGVIAYRRDFDQAEKLFREALAAGPEELPIYYCLYKIHTYHGNLDEARAAAQTGMQKAARQAGWPDDWRAWEPPGAIPDGAGRFALYTLKALAFIHLRRDEKNEAEDILDALRKLDPTGAVGWPVIAELAAGVAR